MDAGRWSLGLPISKGVVLGCFVLILHSHHVIPGGGQPGGGPPGGPGQPGGPGGPGPGSTVNQAPTAAFTFTPNDPPTGPKAGQAVSFDGSGSADPDGTVVAWSWSVGATLHGGGGTSNVSGDGTPHATIRFPTAGIYPVTLTVTDNGGKTSSVTQNVAVSSAGLKSGAFATDPTDMLGCSGTIMAAEDIFIPTYAQTPMTVRGTPTGGCAGLGAGDRPVHGLVAMTTGFSVQEVAL
ncbi:MAG TPA: PKD domain-containing protein [Solirubrobacteraceae bacterium]|nr:PKD domain-containing protein [Solirubrobacteraceae bacterium]